MMDDLNDDEFLKKIDEERLNADMDTFVSSDFDAEKVLSQDNSNDILINRKDWMVQDQKTKRLRPPRLFEFLIALLHRPDYSSYVSIHENPFGSFEIREPEKVADLWEHVKSRQARNKMTYDKFARAIRWYYKEDIMIKTNARYTFQFSPKFLNGISIDENNNIIITTPTSLVK